MKLLIASIAGLALISSPALAQQDNRMSSGQTTTTTHVKSTTRHIHATNVPRTAHHATRTHHHAMRCGCPPSHMKVHHVRHVVKKTTTTTSSSPS
jgi:ABC-type nickel/cobalt efflux system permease component RcnA